MKRIALPLVALLIGLATAPGLHADMPATGERKAALPKVNAAQKQWCDGLLAISKAARTGGDAKAQARAVLDSLYDFDGVGVVFKPTLTTGDQTFRNDYEGALAYFVGGDKRYPNDTGFALKPWTKARFKVNGLVVSGDTIIAVSNVWLTDNKGKVTKVDKTFGYRVDDKGRLHIISHHSSLPYQP